MHEMFTTTGERHYVLGARRAEIRRRAYDQKLPSDHKMIRYRFLGPIWVVERLARFDRP